MGTHGETFLHPFATAAAILAGIGRWHRDNSTPGSCCLGVEDRTELRPAGITDALGEVVVPYHSADLQSFEIDGVRLAHQEERGFMMEVAALPLHLLLLALQEL